MAKRPANPAQSFAKRLFAAAAKVGVNVRVEFHPDGTIVATTTAATTLPVPNDDANELERWMRRQHANPT